MRKWIVLMAMVLGLSFAALAEENAAGTWKASIDTPNGAMESTFVIRLDGNKVTGSITSGMMGTQQISDGKLDGDKISFSITTDFGAISYAGTVKGDDMKLTLTAGGGQFTFDITAHRAKS